MMKRTAMTPKTPCRTKVPSKDSLQVYCRLRPMPSLNDVSCITVISDTTLQLTSPETAVNFRSGVYKETQYNFNRVFDDKTSQKSIYDEVALPLVEQLVKGRNGLLFTYGVTGSGKTYTMTGVPSDGGIMPRCLDVLFNSISEYQSRRHIFKPDKMNGFEVQTEHDAIRDEEIAKGIKSGRLRRKESEEDVRSVRSSRTKDDTRINGIEEDNSYAVFITYIEVYNNSVFDLLENISETDVCSKLQVKIVREDAFRNMYVHGVTEVEVKDANEAFEVFYKGQKRKRMAHTTLNTESSRSHSVFTIRLVQAPLDIRGENVLQDKKMIAISQLSLVDLAGSERTNRTKNCGQRLREAANINNSLMTLRNCLEILRENQISGVIKIIPYRESKLTHLFKNYFDGEGDIRMVVCINPRIDDYDETVQVMKFAEVSQEIQVPRATPMKNDAIGLTPGRRRAHQAYKKAVQILEEDTRNIAGHVPDDVAIIYSLGSFPSLESNGPMDEETNKKLISYLEERIKRMDALKEDMNGRADRFRAALLNHEQNFSRLQQENEYFKTLKEQDVNKIKNLNNKIVSMDSNILSLKRKFDEVDDENKRLKREVNHKETLVNQCKLEKEKEKRKYTAKIAQKTEQLAKEMEQQTKENKVIGSKLKAKANKLKMVKNILQEDNSSDDYKIKRPRADYTDNDDDAKSESSIESYGTAAADLKKDDTLVPSAPEKNLFGVSVSNPRYRRSRSVSDDRWLQHNPVRPVPLNTVFQPQIKNRKSFTKVISPEQVKEMSKYCLMTQNQDEKGELETHLVKGDVIPTAGGGAQVIFNDVETLKQSSPISSPVRQIISAYNQTISGTSAISTCNITNKCSVSIEGHATTK